ncbi:MAG: hypothetical protein WBN89_11730 [Prochlorococcaceae cyanobacterium]
MQSIDDMQTFPAVNAADEGPVIHIDNKVLIGKTLHRTPLKNLFTVSASPGVVVNRYSSLPADTPPVRLALQR